MRRCTRVLPRTKGRECGREAIWAVDNQPRCGRCVQEIYPALNRPRYLHHG